MADTPLRSPGSGSSDGPCQIEPAADAEIAAALKILFSQLSPAVQARTQEALLSAAARGEISFDGLLVARRRGRLTGAVWARPTGAHLANVWPPRVCRGESDETYRHLLASLDGYLHASPVRLAQALLEPDDHEGVRWLAAAGYFASTDLVYLVCPRSRFPEEAPQPPLDFQPYSPPSRQRLLDVVTLTYAGTCDFPELNEVCDAENALLGYQETGAFRPDLWFLVREDGRDIGCLLLADHPQDQQFELLYMGLVPEARGRTMGTHVARQALWLTGQADRRQLVLGVDAANVPALKTYTGLGFIEWDRRRVLLKSFDAKT